MIEYKNKFIELVSPVRLERIEIKNMIVAVNYQEIKKTLSCLVGWLVVDSLYTNDEGYLILKKIK